MTTATTISPVSFPGEFSDLITRAHTGAQENFLRSSADVAIFGGSAGSGKSAGLLLESIRHVKNPGFGAVIFRRTNPQIFNEGALWDTSHKIYPLVGGIPRQGDAEWVFPSGAKIKFSHLEYERTKKAWDGSQVPLICFDELTSFSDTTFWYMFSRNRTTAGMRPYVRCTTNPDADSWVAVLIAWWINQETGFPIPERSGVLRWFVRDAGNIAWFDTKALAVEHLVAGGMVREKAVKVPKSLTFIPAKLEDNPTLEMRDPGYRANLMALEHVERERLLGGNWKVRPASGLKFPRDKWQMYDAPPIGLRYCRFWDKAGTAGPSTGGKGARTAGVLLGDLGAEQARARAMPQFWVVHIEVGRWGDSDREAKIKSLAMLDNKMYGQVTIGLEQEPGPIWEEELVQMGDGSRKKLRDVKAGDMVIGQSGNASAVEAVHEQGLLETLRISTDTGRVIHAAKGHPFLTPHGWVTAENLAVGNILALRSVAKVTPTNGRTLEECRLAGYFVGDGCCTRASGKSINAQVSCMDTIQGEDVRHCAESIGASVHIGGTLHSSYYMSKGIRPWLRDVGLAGKGTDNKNVPSWIFTSSNEHVAHFIGAFFACDGCVSTGKCTTIEFYNTNKTLLEEIQSLLLRFGVYARLRRRYYKPHQQYGRRIMWRLLLRRGDDSFGKFAERVPVFGKKKALLAPLARTNFDQDYFPDEIIEIEQAGLMPCRCITVPGADSFLVNDIVVHNSGGKHSAYMTVTNLAGYDVFAERATTNKSARWSPLAAQQQAGNVAIVRSDTWEWADAIRELDALAGDARTAYADFENLDKGKLKDIADAMSGAFKYLASGGAGLTIEGDLIASGEPGFEDEEAGLFTTEEKGELPEFLRELIDETDNLDDDRGHGRGMNWDRD